MNLQNYKKLFCTGAFLCLGTVSSLFAEDKYWTGAGNRSASNSGNWVGGAAPKARDSWYFNASNLTAMTANNMTVYADQTIVRTVGTIHFDSSVTNWNVGATAKSNFYINFTKGGSYPFSAANNYTWTVENFEKYSPTQINVRLTANNGTDGNYANIHITGDVILDGGNTIDNDNSCTMFGGWGSDLTGGTNVPGWKTFVVDGSFTMGTNERVAFNVGSWANSYDLNRYDTADINLKGGLNLVQSANFYMTQCDDNAKDVAHQSVIYINGLNGTNGTIKNRTDAKINSILVFSNGEGVDATYGGGIQNTSQANWNVSTAQTKVVMMGEGKQTLNGGMFFTGGVDVVKGTLVINQRNSYTMGDLMISGGMLSVVKDDGDGRAYFSNATYKGGTLQFGFSEGGMRNDMMIFGGKFTKDSSGKILVDFTNIDQVLLNERYTLAEWIGASEGLTAADFDCVTSIEGTNIDSVDFSLDDNGLYVIFAGIPEPSAYAALFGVLALAYCVSRRSRR